MKPYNKNNIPLAKNLRKNMTPWERKLWYDFLRNYPIRFQRQKCIGEYIADFYCAKARLVLELDGSQHFSEENKLKDDERAKNLKSQNLKIIRIPNNEINNNFYGVCEYIDNIVKSSLPQSAPQPAPSSEGAQNNSAGLYIHIPFCRSKCSYCDFYSMKYDENIAQNYVDRLKKEFENYRGTEFDTVYFGGGTPSILPPEMIADILYSADKNFKIHHDSEITIECNPSKDLENDFKIYKSVGINRVSIGMQSAVKEERLALGRIAGKKEVAKAVYDAKNAGISNISLDLMIGTPKQTEQGIDETLKFVRDMDIAHISAYMLKIEQGTPFYKMQNKIEFPNEDFVSDMYLKIVDELEKMGLHQYEISNFAKTGYESRHNTKYWKLAPYLGIGATAYSLWNDKRFHYDKDFNIIFDEIGNTDEEKIMLGLRLKDGIDPSIINNNYQKYIDMGYMEIRNGKLSFTPKGFLVSNTILSELI